MIRMDDYKLIVYPYAGVRRLFDLDSDPLEIYDLASATEHQERMEVMFTRLISLQSEMGDTLNLKDFTFAP